MKCTCEWCHREFTTDRRVQRFCSNGCSSQSRKVRQVRQCEYCKVSYEPWKPRGAQRFCSRACSAETMRVRERRACLGCRQPFEVLPHDVKTYCSAQCYFTSRRVALMCRQCQRPFFITRSRLRCRQDCRPKFCGIACRVLWQKSPEGRSSLCQRQQRSLVNVLREWAKTKDPKVFHCLDPEIQRLLPEEFRTMSNSPN